MASRRKSQEPGGQRLRPPRTMEERENHMVSLAMDLAEEQLRSGEASSQVITHFAKLGSSREKLEQQRMAYEAKLTEAKIQAMEDAKLRESQYQEALEAMSRYRGDEPTQREYYDD